MGKDFNSGYWYAFSALIFWSINNVVIKKLTKTEHSRAQLFYSSLSASIFAFPVAYFQFTFDFPNSWFDFANYSMNANLATWPDFSITAYLVVFSAGLASLLHKVSFFKAYKLSDMSVVGPFDYLRLPFTGIFAYLILNEGIPNTYSLVGYGLIVLSGVYFIMHKERRA